MRSVGSCFVLGCAVVFFGCSGEGGSEPEAPTASQTSAALAAMDASESVDQAIALADGLFGIDRLDYDRPDHGPDHAAGDVPADRGGDLPPDRGGDLPPDQGGDLPPDGSPDRLDVDRAKDLGDRAHKDTLKTCGKVTLSGATLTVNFGPAPGCLVRPGLRASGAVALTVSSIEGVGTKVSLAFSKLVVNSVALDGGIALARKNGSLTLSMTALSSRGATLDGSVAISRTASKWMVDGPISRSRAGETSSIAFEDIGIAPGECYPSEGAFAVTTSSLSASVAFDAQTPSTGMVKLKVGSARPVPMHLRPYGSCPR